MPQTEYEHRTLQSFVSLQNLGIQEKYFPDLITDPTTLLIDYKTKYVTAQRALAQQEKRRTLLVRYEDFIADQENTFRVVQHFLGVQQEDLTNGHLKDSTEPKEFSSWKQRSRVRVTKIPNTVALPDNTSDEYTECYEEIVQSFKEMRT